MSDCTLLYTNPWEVPGGTFTFDIQLSYRVDKGNTDIPGGNCSLSQG